MQDNLDIQLEKFLADREEVIKEILTSGLFYPSRDYLIRRDFYKLITTMKNKEAFEKLGIEYNLDVESIRKIVYKR